MGEHGLLLSFHYLVCLCPWVWWEKNPVWEAGPVELWEDFLCNRKEDREEEVLHVAGQEGAGNRMRTVLSGSLEPAVFEVFWGSSTCPCCGPVWCLQHISVIFILYIGCNFRTTLWEFSEQRTMLSHTSVFEAYFHFLFSPTYRYFRVCVQVHWMVP